MKSLLAILLLLWLSPGYAASITGVASVIDGDTLEIRGQRIRLHGIDAPESRQLCTKKIAARIFDYRKVRPEDSSTFKVVY